MINDMNENAQFDSWLNNYCEKNNLGVYKLTDNSERGHGIYQTIRTYFAPGEYDSRREVYYYLWWHGKIDVCGENFIELYRIFERRMAERVG